MTNPYDPTFVPQAVGVQASADNEHLNILKVCSYVWAGMLALIAFFPLIYVAGGVFVIVAGRRAGLHPGGHGASPGAPDVLFGWIMIAIGLVGFVIGESIAFLSFMAARSIGQRRRFGLIMVSAGLNCLSVPFGTTLGIFTFVILLRPSVRAQFPR